MRTTIRWILVPSVVIGLVTYGWIYVTGPLTLGSAIVLGAIVVAISGITLLVMWANRPRHQDRITMVKATPAPPVAKSPDAISYDASGRALPAPTKPPRDITKA